MDRKELDLKIKADRANTLAICTEIIKSRIQLTHSYDPKRDEEKVFKEVRQTMQKCQEIAAETLP
jgi:hypothetical protein